jgi:hypothetical protein
MSKINDGGLVAIRQASPGDRILIYILCCTIVKRKEKRQKERERQREVI